MKSLRNLMSILAMMSLAMLGCALPFNQQQVHPLPTPPFVYDLISRSPDTVYYGGACGSDHPMSFTVTAEQAAGVPNPDRVSLMWAFVQPNGTVSRWQDKPMIVSETAGVFTATVTLDSASVDSIMKGQDGEVMFQVEAAYGKFGAYSTYGMGGESIKLVFCGE